MEKRKMKCLAYENPALAAEWHPTKNDKLTPYDVTIGSEQKVWWLLPYDDPNTGRHFDFEWQASIFHRNNGTGCPFLSGKKVYKGFNDLETLSPELAKQWHPLKNGSLKPSDVTYGSGKKVWWLLPYDDPKTGKHFDFEWMASIDKRYAGRGCPYLTGKKVFAGFNDFATVAPTLALQWNYEKNNGLRPTEILSKSNKKVWWIYHYDDPKTRKHFDFEWEATPYSRINSPGCPFLSSQGVWVGYNDLKTVAPELAEEWNYKKNGDLTPEQFMANSKKKVWWKYHYIDLETKKEYIFEWKAAIIDRYKGDGCPFLSNQRVCIGFNDLLTIKPDIALEWDYDKNKEITPENVTVKSNKKVWWICPKCGSRWRATVSHRVDGQLCKCCR